MAVSPCWSRRRFLAVGLAALTPVSAAGCTLSDPAIERPSTPAGPTTATATAPPSPGQPAPPVSDPVFVRAAGAEQGLATLAAAIRRRDGVTADERAFLRFLEQAHTDHAGVLAGPEPAARTLSGRAVPPATISIRGLSLAKARKLLATTEAKQAAAYRRRAAAASGATALLWGSLAVSAETYATGAADPPGTVDVARHRPVAKLTDVRAVQELVRQQHACVYGYQLAIGRLPVGSRRHRRAVTGLRDHRRQRDDLIAWLTKRDHDVPAAEAAYVPSVVPTDAATAGRLIRRMETALLPFCGIWLAAAGSRTERGRALSALRATARAGAQWGAGLRAWPGYAD